MPMLLHTWLRESTRVLGLERGNDDEFEGDIVNASSLLLLFPVGYLSVAHLASAAKPSRHHLCPPVRPKVELIKGYASVFDPTVAGSAQVVLSLFGYEVALPEAFNLSNQTLDGGTRYFTHEIRRELASSAIVVGSQSDLGYRGLQLLEDGAASWTCGRLEIVIKDFVDPLGRELQHVFLSDGQQVATVLATKPESDLWQAIVHRSVVPGTLAGGQP